VFFALKIFFLATIFVATGGGVFTEWGKKHKVLVVLAGLVAIVGASYLVRDVYKDFIDQVRQEITRTQSQASISPPQLESPTNGGPDTSVTKSVKQEVSLGYLNLRSGPGQNQKVVTRIPGGATGVVLIEPCVPPNDGISTFPFCHVEWKGYQGWVSSNGLE
jgi:hypothetical protein